MGNLPGGWELILILLVVVLVFGSKRLPDSARALGRSMRILKAETKGLHDDGAAAPTTTTAHVVTPVLPAEPVVYTGQQLYDAQGRPVQQVGEQVSPPPSAPTDQAHRPSV